MRNVVVVGASLAGVNAAASLRERGYEGTVTLVGAEDGLPYDRPPLSKAALAGGVDPAGLRLHPREWYSERGIDLRLGVRAERLEHAERTLSLSDGTRLSWDGLVVATGTGASRLPRDVDAAQVHVLRTDHNAVRLHEALGRGGHLLVIGAGFIGLEVAAVARSAGLDVSVVHTAATPLRKVFGPEVGGWFKELHERNGVRFHSLSGVTGIRAHGSGSAVTLLDGQVVRAHTVVAGIGGRPCTSWLEGSGLVLDDGVVCDATLAASLPGVVAAGDVARWPNAFGDGELVRVEHWTNAVEQGIHAAGTLLGEGRPHGSVPSFWTDQYDAKARFVGTARPDDDVAVLSRDDRSLTAVFGRRGVVRAALCVNATRQLPGLRAAVVARTPWEEFSNGAQARGLQTT